MTRGRTRLFSWLVDACNTRENSAMTLSALALSSKPPLQGTSKGRCVKSLRKVGWLREHHVERFCSP